MGKQEIYDRDGGKCFYCGKEISFEKATLEHILALTHGGSNKSQNTTIACSGCNSWVGSKSIVAKIAYRDEKMALMSPASAQKVTSLQVGEIHIEVRENP